MAGTISSCTVSDKLMHILPCGMPLLSGVYAGVVALPFFDLEEGWHCCAAFR